MSSETPSQDERILSIGRKLVKLGQKDNKTIVSLREKLEKVKAQVKELKGKGKSKSSVSNSKLSKFVQKTEKAVEKGKTPDVKKLKKLAGAFAGSESPTYGETSKLAEEVLIYLNSLEKPVVEKKVEKVAVAQ